MSVLQRGGRGCYRLKIIELHCFIVFSINQSTILILCMDFWETVSIFFCYTCTSVELDIDLQIYLYSTYINNVHWIFPCWTLSIKVLAFRMTCMNFDLQVLSQLISLVHWTSYVYMYMYTFRSKSWYSTYYCFHFVRVTESAILLLRYVILNGFTCKFTQWFLFHGYHKQCRYLII